MHACQLYRLALVILGFCLGTMALASAPDDEQARLTRLQPTPTKIAQQQKLPKQQKQLAKSQTAPKLIPARPDTALPEGAIARLGDNRLRHAAPVTCLTFSPDGRRVFSGGQDGTLRAWDVATGEAIGAVRAPTTVVAGVQFVRNGTRLAVNFSDNRIRFLNPESLQDEGSYQFETGFEQTLSPDGTLIAGITSTGLLTVTELGLNLPKLEITLSSAANAQCAFPPDGKTIAVGNPAGMVALYKLAGGKPILSIDHGAALNGIVFSADGKRVATGGGGTLKVWDLTDPKNPKRTEAITGAGRPRFWVGNDRIAAAQGDDTAGIYDLNLRKWVSVIQGITGAWTVSPDGTKLASAGTTTNRLRLWDLETGKPLHADSDQFENIALLLPTPDKHSLFVLSGREAFLWRKGEREATRVGTIPARATSGAAGGQRLAVATPESVLIYDSFDPEEKLPKKPSRELKEFAARTRMVAISPDGRHVAYCGDSARIVIADCTTGKTSRVLPSQTVGLALAFSPDNRTLAVIARDGYLRLWNVESPTNGKEDTDIWRVRMPRGTHGTVAFSPNGKLVAASSGTQLFVIDAATGNEAFLLERRNFEDEGVLQVEFTSDSRFLLTGSAGLTGALQIWDVATHSLVHRFTTGFGAINRLSVFPDGTRAASAGVDETITLWDLTQKGGRTAPR